MAPVPDPVASAYDRWAGTYDHDDNTTRDLDADVLRRHAPDSRRGDVLEVGCGTGKNTVWIAGQARSVVAMDFSAGMLTRARTRVPATAVRWLQHDIREPWPLDDGSFDLVLVNLVLEHVREPGPVMHEVARVLRPSADAFMCELHPFRQLRGGQAHFADPATGGTVYVDACTHQISELVNAALAAGLTLRRLGEWLEPGAPADTPPRLLSLHFTAAAPAAS